MFATINKKLSLSVDFGSAYPGLNTVGYTLYNGDGTTFQSRTTTDVNEVGAGQYRVEVAATVFTTAFDGYVRWDTGGTSPVYAIEDLFVSDRIDIATSAIWSQSSRTLTSVGAIVYTGPVIASGNVHVIQGDDYNAADGRALQWSSNDWPNLTSATITLVAIPADVRSGESLSAAGSVVTPTGTAEVQVELAGTVTAALQAGAWPFALEAVLASGHKATLARGTMNVSANPD